MARLVGLPLHCQVVRLIALGGFQAVLDELIDGSELAGREGRIWLSLSSSLRSIRSIVCSRWLVVLKVWWIGSWWVVLRRLCHND